jgi:RimJ/RimL family protein N-acetyltransferase
VPDLVPHVLPAGALSRRPQPVLAAGHLSLRPWEPDDAPALVAAYADPGVQHWNGASMDEAEAQTYAPVWAEHWRAERRAGWAVVHGDELAGRITLRGIDHEQGSAEVTYWVVPAARGTGVAPAAVAAVVEWAFGQAGFHRLELQHSTGNPASCRVAEKSGFALEGTRVRSLLHGDGWHDMHLHGRTADQ